MGRWRGFINQPSLDGRELEKRYKICPQCLINKEVILYTQSVLQYNKWKYGGLCVQDAFPNATPAEREQLLTGLCSDECWNNYLGEAE